MDAAALSKLRGDLRSEVLVLGGYETSGMPGNSEVRVTLRLVDSRNSDQPAIVEVGREADLFTLSDRLSQDLRTRLGLSESTDAIRNQVRAAFSGDPVANRAYFDGLDRLRQFDPTGARDLFREAIAKDPKAPLPHAALSEAWNILGYDAEAVSEAKKAQETSQSLSRPEQVEIECRALELARADWDGTFRSCQGVWNLRKNLDSGLRLAEVQFSAQHWPDSLRTLDLLRQTLPQQDRDDPRIDILEARVRDELTARPEMLKAAESAEAKAKERGARLLEAQAQLWRCVAQQNLDQLKEAQDSCTAANGVYYAVGDKIGQARAVTNLAHVLLKLDDATAAKKYEEALQLARSVGSKRDMCDALLNYGAALLDKHNFAEATSKLKESWRIGEESQNHGCQARALEDLGIVAKAQGNFKKAQENFADAAKTYSGLQMAADAARVESNTGDLLSRQGHPGSAIPLLKNAASRREQLGLTDSLGLTLLALGDAQLAQADVDGALASYQRAQQIQENLKELQDAATTKIFVSQALLEKGQPAQAESLIRTAITWFADKSDPDDEASARDQLIQALLAQGKKAEAETEAQSLQRLLDRAAAKKDGQQPIQEETLISARIAIARVTVLNSSSVQDIAVLSGIASEAQRRQLLSQECRAQVTVAEVKKARSLPVDRQELARLQREAQSKGLLLLARKLNGLL